MATKKRKKTRKSGVNKSAEVRAAWNLLGFDARPVEIKAKVAEKGIEVSASQIVTVKKQMLEAGGAEVPSARARKVEPRTERVANGMQENGSDVTISELIEVKKALDRLGGRRRVENAIAILEKLQ